MCPHYSLFCCPCPHLDVVVKIVLQDVLDVLRVEDADKPAKARHVELQRLKPRENRAAKELWRMQTALISLGVARGGGTVI